MTIKETLSDKAPAIGWIVSGLLNGCFVISWLLIQWGVNYVATRYPPKGVDSWMLATFSIVFAVSTLIPIIVFIVQDTYVMIQKAKWKMKKAAFVSEVEGDINA